MASGPIAAKPATNEQSPRSHNKERTCPLVSRVCMCCGTVSGDNNRSTATTTTYRWYERRHAVPATSTTRSEGCFPLFAHSVIAAVRCCQEQQETETNNLARTKATPPQTVILIVVSHGLGRSMIVCRISMIVVEVGSIHIQHRLPAAETSNIRRRWPLPTSPTTSGQIQLGSRPCRRRHY